DCCQTGLPEDFLQRSGEHLGRRNDIFVDGVAGDPGVSEKLGELVADILLVGTDLLFVKCLLGSANSLNLLSVAAVVKSLASLGLHLLDQERSLGREDSGKVVLLGTKIGVFSSKLELGKGILGTT